MLISSSSLFGDAFRFLGFDEAALDTGRKLEKALLLDS